MALADRLPVKLPRLDGSRNLLRDLWSLRSGVPAGARYDVPVTLRDAAGEEVARAVLHSLVRPKSGSASDRSRDVN